MKKKKGWKIFFAILVLVGAIILFNHFGIHNVFEELRDCVYPKYGVPLNYIGWHKTDLSNISSPPVMLMHIADEYMDDSFRHKVSCSVSPVDRNIYFLSLREERMGCVLICFQYRYEEKVFSVTDVSLFKDSSLLARNKKIVNDAETMLFLNDIVQQEYQFILRSYFEDVSYSFFSLKNIGNCTVNLSFSFQE